MIFWRDLFVLVDDGQSRASDYVDFSRLILEQSAKYPEGTGGLVIIPEKAKPPPDDVRVAINNAIARLEGRLRCLCWCVEGKGFHAAIARAVLTGIRVFGKRPYPTNVVGSLEEGVGWTRAILGGAHSQHAQVAAAKAYIQWQRGLGRPMDGGPRAA